MTWASLRRWQITWLLCMPEMLWKKGKVLDIFQNPMHPYTIGLLKIKTDHR